MTLWDTHCHLDDPRYDADRTAVLQRARDSGVVAVTDVAADPQAWETARALRTMAADLAGVPSLFFAAGLHPHMAAMAGDELWAALERTLDGLAAVAVGEIGLDYHYTFSSPEQQRVAFAHQLRLARARALPVILHEREAVADMLALLEENGPLPQGGIWHCFTGGPELAERAVALGFTLGFGGMLTFGRRVEPLRAAAAAVPWERVVLETDAPYLAPAPYRGRRNEPAFVVRVAEELAMVRGCSVAEVAERTTANAETVFWRGGYRP